MRFFQFFSFFLSVIFIGCTEESEFVDYTSFAEINSAASNIHYEDLEREVGLLTDADSIREALVENCDVTQMGMNHDNESDWVHVPAGKFVMGCVPERDGPGCTINETPVLCVTITQPFEIMRYEVTRGLWNRLMGDVAMVSDEYFGCESDDCPMTNMSWIDGPLLANALSEEEGLQPVYEISNFNESQYHEGYMEEGLYAHVEWVDGANGYRLPTYAEWHYAARAGENHRFSGSDIVEDVGWVSHLTNGPMPVGLLAPNAAGIYDMTGNQWEWVWDYTNGYNYPQDTDSVDPRGPDEPVLIGENHDIVAHRDSGGGWDGPEGSEKEWDGVNFADNSHYKNSVVRRSNTPIDGRYAPMGHRLVRTLP